MDRERGFSSPPPGYMDQRPELNESVSINVVVQPLTGTSAPI